MGMFIDLKRKLQGKPPLHRRMSTADMRRLQRETALDPDVDRAIREFLAENPTYRMGPPRPNVHRSDK